MQGIKWIIFDADHTLIDYDKDERNAFARLYSAFGVEPTQPLIDYSHVLSYKVWEEVGLCRVDTPEIQRAYHDLYRSHLRILFPRIFEKFGLDLPVGEVANRFLEELCKEGYAVDGAHKLLTDLSKNYRIAIATNGLSSIQRGRLAPFEKYTKRFFISEEMGTIKPSVGFFARMVGELQAEKEECLMVGDSIVSDIDGALSFGMSAVWFNPKGMKRGTPCPQITALLELKRLL